MAKLNARTEVNGIQKGDKETNEGSRWQSMWGKVKEERGGAEGERGKGKWQHVNREKATRKRATSLE